MPLNIIIADITPDNKSVHHITHTHTHDQRVISYIIQFIQFI